MRKLAAAALLCLLPAMPVAHDTAPLAPKGDREALQQRLHKAATTDTDSVKDALQDYADCHDLRAEHAFKSLLPKLAGRVAGTTEEHGRTDDFLKVGLRLHDDGYTGLAEPLLRLGVDGMVRENRTFSEWGTFDRALTKPDAQFMRAARKLGWRDYERPEIMDEYLRYELPAAVAYEAYFNSLHKGHRGCNLFPPAEYERVRELESAANAEGKAFWRLHEADGYAKDARAAWLRFRHAHDTRQYSSVRWNRARNQRAFCQHAMRREGEAFEQVWTYMYAKPFVVYVELPPGRGLVEPELARLREKLSLLAELYTWFHKEFLYPLKLTRQLPQGFGAAADEEAWPLELVAFRNIATLGVFMEETFGRPDDTPAAYVLGSSTLALSAETPPELTREEADTRLAEAGVKMLLDHYVTNPLRGEDWHPRYSSLLVAEGLPLWTIARLQSGGFGGLNKAQLDVYSRADAKRIALNRLIFNAELPLPKLPNMVEPPPRPEDPPESKLWARSSERDDFRATAALYVYFFESTAYREKWRAWLKREFAGKNASSYLPRERSLTRARTVEAFAKVFELETEEDWSRIDSEFAAFVAAIGDD
jgi:hypothetical protein